MSSPYIQSNPNGAPRLPIRSLQRPVGTSFLVHSGLSIGTWLVGGLSNRADLKDVLWPTGMVIDAWYQAVGIHVIRYGLPASVALRGLTYRQALLLGGVTAWGTRLLYRISSRAVKRGRDDPRYTKSKLAPSFWLEALYKQFLPEALLTALISLPFTAPFRSTRVAFVPWGWTDILAVGLFTSGLALETAADAQLANAQSKGRKDLVRDGVFSIVRHPNYLADALTHLSFAFIAMNTSSYNPALFLGPLVNYIFLRFIGGDAEMEDYQDQRYSEFDPAKEAQLKTYRRTTNSFWPAPSEFANKWTWAIVGAGALGVVMEEVARSVLKPGIL